MAKINELLQLGILYYYGAKGERATRTLKMVGTPDRRDTPIETLNSKVQMEKILHTYSVLMSTCTQLEVRH